jgi:predicted metal-dependent hydrolase
MGVTYSSLSITSARSFWRICTAKNELRFSYRLLYVPKEVLEYVIVHELSHIRHKDHSRAFWDEVERYIPDWKEKRAYLKSHALLMRVF